MPLQTKLNPSLKLRSFAILGGWLLLLLSTALQTSAAPHHRTNLVAAVLSEDAARQAELIRGLVDANDPLVEQALIAWRGGALYLYETNEMKVPVLLDTVPDAEGNARATRILDGEVLK